MGSWDFTNIGYICENKDKRRVKKLFECMGVDFSDIQGSDTGQINKMFRCACMGSDNTDLSADEIYSIANSIFKNVTVLYETEDGSSINDSCYRYEKVYDCKKNVIRTGEISYSYDGYEVFGKNALGILKDEIEEEAKKRNIQFSCHEKYGCLIPDYDENEELFDLCEEILKKHGGLEKFGTKTDTGKINKVKVNIEKINKILDAAEEFGYDDIKKLVKDVYKTEYNPRQKNSIRRNLTERQQQLAHYIENYNRDIYYTDIRYEIYDYDENLMESLEYGSVLQVKAFYEIKKEDPEYYISDYKLKMLLFYKNIYLGWICPKYEIGLDSGETDIWLVVKENFEGEKIVQYEYSFMDLDYYSIRREILEQFKDGVDKLEYTDKYENEDQNYVELDSIKNAIQFSNDKEDEFYFFTKPELVYKKQVIIDAARKLNIDYRKYDIRKDYVIPYDKNISDLLNENGEIFELIPADGSDKDKSEINNYKSQMKMDEILSLKIDYESRWYPNIINVFWKDIPIGRLPIKIVCIVEEALEENLVDIWAQIVRVEKTVSNNTGIFIKLDVRKIK